MTQDYGDDADEVNRYAEMMGIPFTVRISPELKSLLKPNEFLSGLGIHFSDWVKTILGTLKEDLIPNKNGQENTVPKEGVYIPLALTKGPFIKEEIISVRAEETDDDGEKVILLTVILE
jgi:hypothetical protein